MAKGLFIFHFISFTWSNEELFISEVSLSYPGKKPYPHLGLTMPRKCRKFLEKSGNPGPLSVLKALDKSLMLLLCSTPSWSSSGSCCALCGRSEELDLIKLNLVQFYIQSMKPNTFLGFCYNDVDSNEMVNGFCASCAQAVTELMTQYNKIRQYVNVFNKARVDLLKTAVTALLVKEKPAMTETLVENVVKCTKLLNIKV